MTILQAYRAAYYFLDERYTQSPSNDLCDLVSGMPLLPDDTPADPAFKEDWNDAVRSITSKTDMSDAEAFAAMIVFMKNWAALGESGDISALIEDLLIQYATEEKATHWKEICKFVKENHDNPKMKLHTPRDKGAVLLSSQISNQPVLKP